MEARCFSQLRAADIQLLSHRQRLRVIANSLVELPKLERLVTTLGDLADNARGLTSNDAEARYDHIRGHDGAVEDADVVFNDSELADDNVLADVDVASDRGGLDDGSFADKDVVT